MNKYFGISLIAVLALLWAVGSVTAADEVNEYIGDSAKKCAMCHKDQVAAWKEWPMAKAWDRLSDEEKTKDECIKCHVTGYGEPGGFVSEKETPNLVGVHCEACHGPAGAHMKAPLADKEARIATMTPPTEASCKVCHQKEGNPNFKEFKYEDAVKELADHLAKK